MPEAILVRIEGAGATAAFADLNAWLEAEAGFRLTPEPTAPMPDLRSDGDPGRLARAERIYNLTGTTASIAGLLMVLAGSPEAPPPAAPSSVEYEQLVDGAARLLDKLKELGCEREFSIDLLASESGTNLRVRADTAPADVVKLCLQARAGG